VCSCTVLPIFKGIYRKGAGLGPAVAFLYSGPAINILAIVLSVKVFGLRLGMARTVGAIVFSIVTGWLMATIFRKDDAKRAVDARLFQSPVEEGQRTLAQTALYMASMIGILVFANWTNSRGSSAVWDAIHASKWWITGACAVLLAITQIRWFNAEDRLAWLVATRDFALQIMPLLFGGVLAAGFLLGRPGHEALIPGTWVAGLVGGNSVQANLFASVAGALMYFATLTEIPIVQGLLGAGMGQGPALALLLAGPSLSLPSILVIASELGWKKTLTYVGLVVILSTIAGIVFGTLSA
ncbi:MAG: permease, partial [Rectinema sp.]|nr:permease [Rectinema sp.]